MHGQSKDVATLIGRLGASFEKPTGRFGACYVARGHSASPSDNRKVTENPSTTIVGQLANPTVIVGRRLR